MSYSLTALLVMLLMCLSHQQIICQSCVDVNSNNFTCNNIGCDGFMLTPNQNSTINFNTINCINGGTSCYYTSKTIIAPRSYVVYLFCNYTFNGCSSCTNDQTCNQCQNGFFYNVYNPTLQLTNCQPCQDYIGGCQMCYVSTTCSQCNPQYLNIFGFCYTQGGSIVGSTSKPWNKYGSTPTEIITAVELFLIVGVIFFVLYKFCCSKPAQNNNANYNYEPPKINYTQQPNPINDQNLYQKSTHQPLNNYQQNPYQGNTYTQA